MGQYERQHRCNFNTGILRRKQLEQSYPMLLRQAGYHTGFIGKYGVGDGQREIEGEAVFDRWYGFYGQGSYFPKSHPGQHLNAVMIEQARDFLERAPADQPWCLSISFKAPHSGRGYVGYEAELDLQHLYADLTIPMPPTAKPAYFDALPEFLRRGNARTNYEQLFDLQEDPNESNDLARTDQHATSLARLRQRLEALRAVAEGNVSPPSGGKP